MSDGRSMEYVAGAFRFFWRITDDVIRVFDDRTHRYLADLHINGKDGEILPFERAAFEGFVDWFLLGAMGGREPDDDPSEGLELENELDLGNPLVFVAGGFVIAMAVLCAVVILSH